MGSTNTGKTTALFELLKLNPFTHSHQKIAPDAIHIFTSRPDQDLYQTGIEELKMENPSLEIYMHDSVNKIDFGEINPISKNVVIFDDVMKKDEIETVANFYFYTYKEKNSVVFSLLQDEFKDKAHYMRRNSILLGITRHFEPNTFQILFRSWPKEIIDKIKKFLNEENRIIWVQSSLEDSSIRVYDNTLQKLFSYKV